ncbi:MAG TPA: hypothetical protein VGL20_12450 [Candidatus Dormibacteraeota bacterium]
MTAAVVDPLEVVEVEGEHRERPALSRQPRQRVTQPVVEQLAIGQSAEGVVEGAMVQLALQRQAVGDVVGDDQLGVATIEGELLRGDLDLDAPAVAQAVLPDPGGARAGEAHPLAHPARILGRPDVEDAHGEELVARVPVVRDRRIVDGEEAQRPHVVDPHRLRAALEERPEGLLAAPRLGDGAPVVLLARGPRIDVGRGRGEHEATMDECPAPGMQHLVDPVVHRAGVDHPHQPVLEDHEGEREEERDPVPIRREQPDHDEEVEVRLDGAVGEVDQHRGAGHQPQCGEHRAEHLTTARLQRRQRQQRHRGGVGEAVAGRVSARDAEQRQRHDVEPEDAENDAVAPPPRLGFQPPALGKRRRRAAQRCDDGGGHEHVCGQAAAAPAAASKR